MTRETKTITMSYDNLEAAMTQFLYSIGAVPKDWDIVGATVPKPKGSSHVVFDIDVVRPARGKEKLEGKQLALDIFGKASV